jgi:hypothetical protein
MAAPEFWSPKFAIGSIIQSTKMLTSTTVLRDGWIVVTLLDPADSKIKYRIFNADGTAFTNTTDVSAAGQKTFVQPNISDLPDGRFIIAYEDRADTVNSSLLLKTYDVFNGIVGDGSFVAGASSPLNPVISSFADGSYNITYEKDVDGLKYYHRRSSSGSDTSYYGDVEGDYHFSLFGAEAVSIDQASYATVYYRYDTAEAYINIRNKNGDSIARKLEGRYSIHMRTLQR